MKVTESYVCMQSSYVIKVSFEDKKLEKYFQIYNINVVRLEDFFFQNFILC